MDVLSMTGIHPVQPALSRQALNDRLETALMLAGQAGAMAMRMRPPPGAAQASLKSRQDWLTAADGAVEQFLSEALLATYPDDGFQGEEGGTARPGALRWVVDPIDGTSNFARGGSRWCVSIGLLAGQAAVLGVLAAPALGEIYAAVRDGGATLNGAPIRVAATAEMGRAIIECGWSPRVSTPDYLALWQRVMALGAMPRSGGSGALGLADVAAGRIDGYLEQHINLWDCCGALAILREAGAHVNDFLARSMVGGGPVLACTPGLAAPLGGGLAG